MPGEVDRQHRMLKSEHRRVPRVGVEAGAVQQRDTGRLFAEPESADVTAVREGKRHASDGWYGDPHRLRLCGKIVELAGVDRHLHILLCFQGGAEMQRHRANSSRVYGCHKANMTGWWLVVVHLISSRATSRSECTTEYH